MVEDFSVEATKGYILHELEECSRTVQYFTDGTNVSDRSEITTALGLLIQSREITRRGSTFSLSNKTKDINE